MPRFLLNLALFIILSLTVAGVLARALGSTQVFNPIMREFVDGCESQPRPCWYGIVPGTTTVNEARTLLASRGYTIDEVSAVQIIAQKSGEPCPKTLSVSASTVRQVNLKFCQPLLLGDFMEHTGQPDYIMLDPLSIWYQGQMQILFIASNASWDTVSYYTPLQEIVLFPASSPLPPNRAAWFDLLTQRKYCQLKGLTYRCGN